MRELNYSPIERTSVISSTSPTERVNRSKRFKLRSMLTEQLEDRRLLFADNLHAQLVEGQLVNGELTGGLPLVAEARQQIVASSNSIAESSSDPEAKRDYNHFFGSAFSSSAAKINERYLAAITAADPLLFNDEATRATSLETIASNFARSSTRRRTFTPTRTGPT
jgi:hypothetical protein